MNVLIDSKIESMILLLEKLEAILGEHKKQIPLQEFLLYAAEKKAEEIVELAVSINQELLKTKGKTSLSYYASFTDLSAFAAFSKQELIKLASTAGFRNRLAHEYLEVNTEIALRTMKRMILIYPNYLKKIKKIM